MLFRVFLSVLPLLLAFIVVAPANGNDRHAGYYYPPIASDEFYRARSRVMDNANRAMRIGFIVAQTEVQRKRIYPPRYAIFTKGDEAENLIIVGLDGHSFSTLYRARGVLAQLTASARASTFLETSQLKIYLLSLILLGCLVLTRLRSVTVKPIHIGSTLNSSSDLMPVCSAYLSSKFDFVL